MFVQGTVCQQCGDEGFTNALVYCVRCLDVAVHRYCLDVVPETVDEFVHWFCENCHLEMQKKPVGYQNQLKKNGVVAAKIKEPNYDEGGHDRSYKLHAKHELVECAESSNKQCPEEFRASEEKKRWKTSSSQHLEEEKLKVSLVQQNKSLADTSLDKGPRKRRRIITLSAKEKKQHKLSNNFGKGPYEEPSTIDSGSIPLGLKKHCLDMSTVEGSMDQRKYLNEIRESDITEEGTSASNLMSNLPEEFPRYLNITPTVDCCAPAEPVLLPIWRGSFNIQNRKELIDGLMAHMSSRACQKAYEEAHQFQPVLQLEVLPKLDIWPKSFGTSEPGGEHIALYLFPSNASERVYDSLVDEMMSEDLALRAIMQNAELLVFTSMELQLPYWRFQGKYYLWGVFRAKQQPPISPSQSCERELRGNMKMPADLLCPRDTSSDRHRVPTAKKGSGVESVVSSLINSCSYGSGSC